MPLQLSVSMGGIHFNIMENADAKYKSDETSILWEKILQF